MELVTYFGLAVLGLLLIYKYFFYESRNNIPPGPKRFPVVGSALQLREDQLLGQFSSFATKFGDIFEIQIFNSTILVLNTADVVNKAFCEDRFKYIFNDRPAHFFGDYVLSRKGITISNAGKQHSDLRKTLSRGLHVYGEGIPRYESIIKTEIASLMEQIDKFGETEFEVVENLKRSICNVMTILFIGEQGTDEDFRDYLNYLEGIDFFAAPMVNSLLLKFPSLRFSPFFKPNFDKLVTTKRNLLNRLFFAMRESRTPGTIRGLTDYYLEEQEKEMKEGKAPCLTDEIIKDNILDAMSAGIATTSSALPNALLCLANHPDYQIKIQEELDRVVGRNGEPNVSHKRDCHFVEAVVMETLRLMPPAPLLFPHMCSEDTKFAGYDINAGTHVLANIWHIHHDEKVWGDPWVFRPERFLDESGKLLPNTHVYMKSPFYGCYYCAYEGEDIDCLWHVAETHPNNMLKMRQLELNNSSGKMSYRTLDLKIIPHILESRNQCMQPYCTDGNIFIRVLPFPEKETYGIADLTIDDISDQSPWKKVLRTSTPHKVAPSSSLDTLNHHEDVEFIQEITDCLSSDVTTEEDYLK